jgi:hypothetical protein
MALTLNQLLTIGGAASGSPGTQYWGVAEMFADNSYPTGGYDVTTVFPFAQLIMFIPLATSTGAIGGWDEVNSKVQVFTAGVETTAATDLSALKIYALVFGKY